MKSVYVEQFTPNPTMVWNENIQDNDMIQAFNDLRLALDKAHTPQYVIVILSKHVNFPLANTILHALPIHRHPKLKSWLVVGDRNSLAQVIANVLSKLGEDDKVLWFKSKVEVEQYLLQQDDSCLLA